MMLGVAKVLSAALPEDTPFLDGIACLHRQASRGTQLLVAPRAR